MSAPNAHAHGSAYFGPGAVIRRASSAVDSSTYRSPDYNRDHADADRTLDSLLTPDMMDELVERVIDRIEERVIVELERRGRRSMPDVF
jgi:hypothetical protein